MAIKSIKELETIRKELQNTISFRRESTESAVQSIEILVGVGTCGVAAGAQETFNKFEEFIKSNDLDNVKVIGVGCVGFCHSEPTVQINIPGKDPVIYGFVTEDNADELLETVLIKGEILEKNYLVEAFNKAVV
jgi:NADP-reducing hydrogenase subunit HndB